MSPTQFHDQHHHAKKEITSNGNAGGGACPPPLKVSKDSHGIKKSASSSSSSSAASSLGLTGTAKPSQQQRHPVIIYTHSPKVIHTHPKDFMGLVQKLTGLSRNDHQEDLHHHHHKNHNNHHQAPQQPKAENGCGSGGGGAASAVAEEDSKRIVTNDDNESSSVITDENCEGQVNSCFVPPLFDPPPAPFLTNIPVFTPNSADFLCVNQPYYNYTDSLFFTPNMRSSISSSSSGLDGINEFRDY
ncbi:VQ motif-containing protein [Corchorus capsularis]|uniref:VQ motif-containing protein n=1 Tax=Corchorus capsularis TaxID=210143 RepID=A0A1R3JQ59_COCAP|nr:VQ motif-containing protein [Corchorus capsularis]